MHTSGAAIEDVLAALGNRVRLEIVSVLLDGECCVCEITPDFSQERSVVSRHLAVLERAGIIRSRKVGRRVFYQIADERAVVLLAIAREMAAHPEKGVPVGPQSGLACCAPRKNRRTNGKR
jgi:ArsR family transcriptional regulator